MKFTEEEQVFIRQYSIEQPLSKTLVFFACVLFAPIGFAIYGALNFDPIAVLVVFSGLLVFIIWYVSASIRSEKTLNSICKKIIEQNANDGSSS